MKRVWREWAFHRVSAYISYQRMQGNNLYLIWFRLYKIKVQKNSTNIWCILLDAVSVKYFYLHVPLKSLHFCSRKFSGNTFYNNFYWKIRWELYSCYYIYKWSSILSIIKICGIVKKFKLNLFKTLKKIIIILKLWQRVNEFRKEIVL